MILSRHRLVSFWLKGGDRRDPPTEQATVFLRRAVSDLLGRCREGYRRSGSINRGYDPKKLPGYPGYAWLSKRLEAYAREFPHPQFDQRPEDVREPDYRRDPFPAFHWQVLLEPPDASRSEFRLEVLVGRDVVAFHQWELAQASQNSLDGRSCRLRPFQADHTLFTADFLQVTPGNEIERIAADLSWSSHLFRKIVPLPGCPPFNWAVRDASAPRSFEGLVVVDAPVDDLSQSAAIREVHIHSTGFLSLLCVALTSLAKVKYEYAIAGKEVHALEQRLESRRGSVEALLLESSRRVDLVERLCQNQLKDQSALDCYDGLIKVCELNCKRFEAVVRQLKLEGAPWVENSRAHCQIILDNLKSKAPILRRQHSTIHDYMQTLAGLPPGADRSQKKGCLSENPQRTQVFISYSHKDKEVFLRLKEFLRPLLREYWDQGLIWDDTQISPGEEWKKEIQARLSSAKIALLLVSVDYLNSEFALDDELPPLLESFQRDGLILQWILIGPCYWEKLGFTVDVQALNRTNKPLNLVPCQDRELDRISRRFSREVRNHIHLKDSRPSPLD